MDSPPEWVRFAFHLERPLLLLLWIGFWGAAEGWVPRVRIVFALGQGILFALNIRFQLWDCGWLWSRVRSCNGYVEYSYCSGGIFCSFSLFESGLRVHRSFWSLLSPILGLLRIQVEFSCFNFARHIFFLFFFSFCFYKSDFLISFKSHVWWFETIFTLFQFTVYRFFVKHAI